jgi:tight adherence protein B
MLPLILALTLGAGVYLFYDGLTRRPAAPAAAVRPRLGRVQALLSEAGLHELSARAFVLFSVAAALLVALVAQIALGWGLVSGLSGALGLVIPWIYVSQRGERRRAVYQSALVDAITHLRDAIRTGLSVQEALIGVARSGPEALRGEFTWLARETRLVGFEPALIATRDRLADPVFDVVAATLLLNDRLGGRNVSQVLDRLADATRAQQRIQEELRAYQSRNVLSARIVALVPAGVLIAIRQVNPTYLSLFDDVSGQLILAACVASVAIGYFCMLWMTRLPGMRRVLIE